MDNEIWYIWFSIIKKKSRLTSPHIACMTIGPKRRNLDGNSKNNKDRYLVCIRWNFIKENIIEFKNNKKERDE